MKKTLVCILLALLAFSLKAASVGDWTFYLSYRNNTCNVPAGDEIYGICEGNLFSYHTKDSSVRFFSRLDGMSGQTVQLMGYSAKSRMLVLVYEDGNIDLFSTVSGEFFCLPQLRLAEKEDYLPTNLTVTDDLAILSTRSGVALINLAKKEIKGFYSLGENVTAAALFDGTVYAATASGLLYCPLSSNMSDKSEWKQGPAANVSGMAVVGGTLYLGVAPGSPDPTYGYGLWARRKQADGGFSDTKVLTHNYTSFFSNGSRAVFSSTNTIAVFGADSPLKPQAEYAATTFKHLHASCASDGTLWISGGTDGLQAYKAVGGELRAAGEPVGGYGPARDLCFKLNYVGNRLLVAGGRQESSNLRYDGTVMALENGRWTIFQEGDEISSQTGLPYFNCMEVVQDASDPMHHFVSTYGTGMYEFRNFKMVKNYSVHNSPLLVAAGGKGNPRYVRVSGLTYDDKGNLWMLNDETDTLLHVLKADGTWSRIYVDQLKLAPTVYPMLFDRSGRLWVASRRTVSYHTTGLLCLDYNGTIDYADDDVTRYRTQCPNEDGTTVSFSKGVYALMQDTDGSIWVGAGNGLFVVPNPDEWFDSDFTIRQIKVPRNDGTNYADYLLADVPVSSITTDGAGRKWIGTLDDGTYLVSADGTEILQHFTAENSPLLSDIVYSVAVNPETGEVMMATNRGLCSYRGDATEPAATLVKSNVKVYPNPVRPEHTGPVTITGLTLDADVVVTTTGGQAVAQGTSQGGTFVWDGRSFNGRRVASGVYYIMVSTADAKKGLVAKVVVI